MQCDGASFIKIINRLQKMRNHSFKKWVAEYVAVEGEYQSTQDLYAFFRKTMYLSADDTLTVDAEGVGDDEAKKLFTAFVVEFYAAMDALTINRILYVDAPDGNRLAFGNDSTIHNVSEGLFQIDESFQLEMAENGDSKKGKLFAKLVTGAEAPEEAPVVTEMEPKGKKRQVVKCDDYGDCKNKTKVPAEEGWLETSEGGWSCTECQKRHEKEEAVQKKKSHGGKKSEKETCTLCARVVVKDPLQHGWGLYEDHDQESGKTGLLCPECMQEHYPDLESKLSSGKKAKKGKK